MSALPNPNGTMSVLPATGQAEVADDTWQRLDSGALFALVYDRKFRRLVEISIVRDDSFHAPYDVIERGGPYKVHWIGYRSFDAVMRMAEGRRAEIAGRVPADSPGEQDAGGQPAKARLHLIERPRGA